MPVYYLPGNHKMNPQNPMSVKKQLDLNHGLSATLVSPKLNQGNFMAFFNRRTGIAGLTVAALLCMICGIPFIAAILGIGGFSVSVFLLDLPAALIIAILIAMLIMVSVVIFLAKRQSNTADEKTH